jgi:hypothetical protein
MSSSYARSYLRATSDGFDPELARSTDDLVVHVGDVLHIPEGEAPGPRETDEEVKLGVGLDVPRCGRSLTVGPDEQPDPA